jgi:phosphate uptake regulator
MNNITASAQRIDVDDKEEDWSEDIETLCAEICELSRDRYSVGPAAQKNLRLKLNLLKLLQEEEAEMLSTMVESCTSHLVDVEDFISRSDAIIQKCESVK